MGDGHHEPAVACRRSPYISHKSVPSRYYPRNLIARLLDCPYKVTIVRGTLLKFWLIFVSAVIWISREILLLMIKMISVVSVARGRCLGCLRPAFARHPPKMTALCRLCILSGTHIVAASFLGSHHRTHYICTSGPNVEPWVVPAVVFFVNGPPPGFSSS